MLKQLKKKVEKMERKGEERRDFRTLPGSLEQVLARGMYLLKERVQELKDSR